MQRLVMSSAIATIMALALAAPAAAAGTAIRASQGDPFAGCIGVGADPFGGVNNPNAEVEPWTADNPRDTDNLVSVWQQDRWNDGGAKGLVAGWSNDGGRSWNETPLPFSKCANPSFTFDRASDPWDSFGPDGKVYGQGLVFNAADNHNGVASATSVDGGRSWQNLRLVIDDPASDPTLPVDDKNSVTADPNLAGVAYAVWDRIAIIPCGTAMRHVTPQVEDRPAAIRGTNQPTQICTAGPTLFSRTTDGGVTWSTPRVIVPTGINAQTIGNVIVVNRQNGTLFDFFDFIDASGVFHNQQVFSRDHGLTWSAPQEIGLLESAALQPGRGGVVDPRDSRVLLRTGDIIPEPAIDPASGRLYLVWQDARFNGNSNDQVVIATSGNALGLAGTWTSPTLVSPVGDHAAFNPAVNVNLDGHIAIMFQDFRRLDGAPATILPTDVWSRVFDGPNLGLQKETHLAGSFNFLAAPTAGGFFVGDYQGMAVNLRTGGFTAVFGATDCADTSCMAISNPTGAPTGGLDPTDVFTRRVGPGDD